MKKLKFNFSLKKIINLEEAEFNKLNILNVNYNNQKIFSKISIFIRNYGLLPYLAIEKMSRIV